MSKVAIIIPIYNVEEYVRKTIESAVNQTENDIEIILVDDGSKDSSGRICDEYAASDSRIKVIHKENGGLSSARNAGINVASSEYVMFLDGDDYLSLIAVARLLNVMKDYPADIIQFRYKEVNENQKIEEKEICSDIYQAETSKELFEILYKLGGVAASGVTKFMRRELAVKIPFENVRHEDEMWCTRAFQNNLTVTYIPDELYYYVMREGSIIHSSFNRHKLDGFTVSDDRLKVLRSLRLDDLVSCEYRRLFHLILSLYNEAKCAGDQVSVSEIHTLFEKRKNEIKQYAQLQGKFRWIFRLMCWNFAFVDIYRLYWKMKGI